MNFWWSKTLELLPLVSEWKISQSILDIVLNDIANWTSAYQDVEFVVFDTETTGLGARTDEIIEIGAVIVKNNQIKHKDWSFKDYEYYISSPERFKEMDSFPYFIVPKSWYIPEKIVELTHISMDKIIAWLGPNAPEWERSFENFPDAFNAFIDFIDGRPLVAHNANFDTKMFKIAFTLFQNEIDLALNNPDHPLTKRKIAEFFNLDVIDTYSDAKKLLTINPNLSHQNGVLSEFFWLPPQKDLLHRAIYDVVFTSRNLFWLYEYAYNTYNYEIVN